MTIKEARKNVLEAIKVMQSLPDTADRQSAENLLQEILNSDIVPTPTEK